MNGPSSLKAGAANFRGGLGGLNSQEWLSLPGVCESLRTRERRNPGTGAQAKGSAFRRSLTHSVIEP